MKPNAHAGLGVAMVVGAMLVTTLSGCAENITDSDIRSIPVTEVRSLTLRQAKTPDDKVIVLIDPRAGARFDAGHLPGARNLKLPQVPQRSGTDPAIAAYNHIVVYGTDPGSAAARAMTKRLMSVGYDGVRMFAGGTSEWVEKGYVLETSGDLTPPSAEMEPGVTAPGDANR